jgi:hypothetical protein
VQQANRFNHALGVGQRGIAHLEIEFDRFNRVELTGVPGGLGHLQRLLDQRPILLGNSPLPPIDASRSRGNVA